MKRSGIGTDSPIRVTGAPDIAAAVESAERHLSSGPNRSGVPAAPLICEELLLNIIKFGISHEHKNYYISIRLMEKDGDYVLRIRDNVHLYNPFESSGDHIDSGILKLIRMKTKYCDYQRKMIFNYLYMII
jgi:LytS/YehU family sensor histidine kinase